MEYCINMEYYINNASDITYQSVCIPLYIKAGGLIRPTTYVHFVP